MHKPILRPDIFIITECKKKETSSLQEAIEQVDWYVDALDGDINTHTLTVSNNGAVLDCFYQAMPFIASSDVYVTELVNHSYTRNIALFLKPILELLKNKYSYGRKLSGIRFQSEKIKLPSTPNGCIDWEYMENYITSIIKQGS